MKFSRSQVGAGLAVALVAFAGLTFTSGQFVPVPGPSGGGGSGTLNGSGTSPDLAAWSAGSALGNYAGSASSQCGAGSAANGVTLNAQGSAFVNCVAVTGGTSGFFAPTLSTIPTSSNTGLNAWMAQPASATVNDDANGLVVFDPNGGSSVANALRVRTAPATPYKIKVLVSLSAAQSTNTSVVFGFANGATSAAKEQVILFKPFNTGGTDGLGVDNFTNSTTFSGAVVSWAPQMISPYIWLRISDDGTTAKYEVSPTGDDDMWISVVNVTKSGSFLGASGFTNIIFGSSAFNGDARGELLSWSIQ